MKMYKIILLKFLMVVGLVGSLTSCSFSSRNHLYAYADEADLTSRSGTEYYIRLYLSDEGRYGSNELLGQKEPEYGSFQLYSKDSQGRSYKEGTEYWIFNVKGEEGSDTKIFSLAFADVNGERKNVLVNKMTFHDDKSITVNFGEDFPFASDYEFRISSVEDYPLPMYSPKPSLIFPFLKNYAGVYVPLLKGWGEVFFVGLAILLLLYVGKLRVWTLFQKILLLVGAVLAGGMYFSWLIFIPIVIPILISLPIMFVPFLAKNVKKIYWTLVVFSYLFCIWKFFKLEGFWMGAWMTAYIYICSFSFAFWVSTILDHVCPICGRLILDTYENSAYANADEAMLASWDVNGNSDFDENDIVADEAKQKEQKPICYWCIDNNFRSNDDDDEDDDDEEIDLDALYIK